MIDRIRHYPTTGRTPRAKYVSSRLMIAVGVLLTALLPHGFLDAQQPKKLFRIGYLGATSISAIPERIKAFREGLRELGYVEGKTVVIEYRWADGKLDRLPALAAELVDLKVDVIVTGGPTNTRAAKAA